MYERFYGLRERPFALSPDPDYLYPSRVHREALDYLRYGLETHAGFVVITGEIGSGKTTLLQTLLRGIDGEMAVARLLNTMLEPRELLEAIVIDLVHARSKGVPRMINVVCDAILLFGYGEERRYFDRAFAEDVMKELEASGVLPKSAAGSTDQAGRSADVP